VKDVTASDVIEVRIDEIPPRPSCCPDYEGRAFGSSVAAWWGYRYNESIQEPKGWILTGVSHPKYLAKFASKSQGEIYAKSSLRPDDEGCVQKSSPF
jgi:hypothetical protein